MTQATARTGIDAFTKSDAPTQNVGLRNTLVVRGSGPPYDHIFVFLKTPVPRGANVIDAHFKICGVGNSGATFTVTLERIAAKWNERTIDYSNEPGVTGSAVSVTGTQSADGQVWDFDVTPLLQTVANGGVYYGFRLTTSSSSQHLFYSLNASDNRPVLEVEWSDAPDAPTELIPSAGAAVSVAKPVLQFNYHDVSGSVELAAVQVQINGSNVWTSPTFDSGTVATSDPELDLATTSYAGISIAATAWWRVRVQDAAGLWSDWSTGHSFTRVAKGTLTITNPPAPTSNFVEDATPTLTHTLTGATQTAARWQIIDEANPTVVIHDSGKRTTTATSYTLPDGVITSDTATYREILWVWDNQDRVQTPGDKVYLEASRLFTYQDGVLTQVTSLTAVQSASGQPHVKLEWDSAVAPDYFSIWRNGKVIAHDIDPAEHLVSGTSYRFFDLTAPPHVTNVYKVKRKVSGVLSASPTASVAFEVPAIWLLDPDSKKLVPILIGDDDSFTFDMPEVAGEYVAINGDSVIRIVQAQRGLEGSISGHVLAYAGGAAVDWVNNFLYMKARPQQTYRLSIGAQNLPVKLGHMVSAPKVGGGPDDRKVSLYFWAQGGPR